MCISKRFDHGIVGIALFTLVGKHSLPGEAWSLRGKRPVFIDRVRNIHLELRGRLIGFIVNKRVDELLSTSCVGYPNVEILATVPGSRMNETSARFIRNVVALKQGNGSIVAIRKGPERMSKAEPA